MILVVLIIRLLNALLFNTFLSSAPYEISTLLKNVISIIIFIVAFIIILKSQFSTRTKSSRRSSPVRPFIGNRHRSCLAGHFGQFFCGRRDSGRQAVSDRRRRSIFRRKERASSKAFRGAASRIRTFQNKIVVVSNAVLGKEIIRGRAEATISTRGSCFLTRFTQIPRPKPPM